MTNATLFKHFAQQNADFHFHETNFASYDESNDLRRFSRLLHTDLPLKLCRYDVSNSRYRCSKFWHWKTAWRLYVSTIRDEWRRTRNKSITSKAMLYLQDYCHTNAHYAGGFNNYLNSNPTKYLAKLCGRFFCVLENFCHKFANLVAQPIDGTTKRLVRCKAHPVL